MAVVMIGVDPHKASHTAVAISAAEEPLGELRVRACAAQAERLLAWAAAWPQRTWAVEGAGGLGHLLARQLLGAGERVLDVQPKLGARVRLRRSRCPPARARPAGCPGAGTGGTATPSTWPRSLRSATPTARAARTTTRSWPRARRRKKPFAR